VANQKKPQIKADLKKNRLYITIAGRLNKKELDGLYTDIRFCVADLQPGFDVINDLTECTLAALSGMSTYNKITEHLVASKVGKVIRIIDERRIVFKQMLNSADKMRKYTPIYVKSLEEAEEELDKR
jgi:hypothetical protein